MFLIRHAAIAPSAEYLPRLPTAPLVLYALGAVPVSLRAFVPEAALDLGLVALAVGIGWIAIWLFSRSGSITTTWADRDATDVVLAGASR